MPSWAYTLQSVLPVRLSRPLCVRGGSPRTRSAV
jgi:hypothetical protein